MTGASGFIGRHLTSALASEGRRVRCAVRPGAHFAKAGPLVEVVRVDGLEDARGWGAAVRGVETIVHLAASMPDDPGWKENSGRLRRINVEGARRLATAAVHEGARRLVFVSSIGVYGPISPAEGFRESDAARPRNAYSRCKLEVEEALREVGAGSGLETVVLRAPIVYGPGGTRRFGALVRLVATGVPLPLAGIRNARSLLFVDNLIDAIQVCTRHPDAAGRLFLVSDGSEVSTPALIRLLAGELGRRARLFRCPRPLLKLVGTMVGARGLVLPLTETLVANTGLIRETLQWRPPCALTEGVRRTVAWHRGRPS